MAETTLDAETDGPTPPAPPVDGAPRRWWARRRDRVSKWDRPRHPFDWRSVVGTLGRVLVATGLLLFGFVAYQLWGTGLETARAQRQLEEEFSELLTTATTVPPAPATSAPADTATTVPSSTPASTPEPSVVTTPATEPATTTTVPRAVDQALPPVAPGDPIARIEMPTIGVDDIVVAGVGVEDLRKGPGHFPDTPLPGQLGNAAIAGHRTTYGQPFRNVDDLDPGDPIVLTTLAGTFVYTVTGTEIVAPNDYWVVATSDPDVASITLVSCHPVYSAAQRIVVRAELVPAMSSPVGLPTPYADEPGSGVLPELDAPATAPPATDPVTDTGVDTGADTTTDTTPVDATTPSEGTGDVPSTTTPSDPADAGGSSGGTSDGGAAPGSDDAAAVSDATSDAFSRGWFHDRGAFWQVALWGLVLIVLSMGAYLLSRRTRHDSIGFVVGVVPFAIALFFFFQNVNRLLPPNL